MEVNSNCSPERQLATQVRDTLPMWSSIRSSLEELREQHRNDPLGGISTIEATRLMPSVVRRQILDRFGLEVIRGWIVGDDFDFPVFKAVRSGKATREEFWDYALKLKGAELTWHCAVKAGEYALDHDLDVIHTMVQKIHQVDEESLADLLISALKRPSLSRDEQVYALCGWVKTYLKIRHGSRLWQALQTTKTRDEPLSDVLAALLPGAVLQTIHEWDPKTDRLAPAHTGRKVRGKSFVSRTAAHVESVRIGRIRQVKQELGSIADSTLSSESFEFSEEIHRAALMQASLGSLSAREVEALELRAHGLRYKQIAANMNVSRESVKTYLKRAREKIRESRPKAS